MYARRPRIVHPMLFAVYPILHLYAMNVDAVSFWETLLPLGFSLAICMVILLLLKLVVRDRITAATLTSAILIWFFSYGHTWRALERFHLATWDRAMQQHDYLLLLWGLLFLLAVLIVAKARSHLPSVTNCLNVAAALLVSVPIVTVGSHAIRHAAIGRPDAAPESHAQAEVGGRLPDIYYIILDSYARSDILSEVYGHDNSEFIEYLTNKGFYVAERSRSNYALTYLSLASSLNMEYLDYLGNMLSEKPRDRTIPLSMIVDNRVSRTLRAAGYRFVHFSSGYGPTEYNRFADISYRPEVLSDFRTMLLETTLLNPIVAHAGAAQKRARTLFTFQTMGEIPQIEDPTFVFAHLMVPRPPFVFDRDCSAAPSSQRIPPRAPDGASEYVEQLICVNKMVETLVDDILASSEAPPIIILQGDHGRESTYEWHHPTEAFLRERMSIFNAYYLPDHDPRHLYPSITPVNSFRLVFDLYLGTNLGLLEDESLFSTEERPYEFARVME